MIEKTKPQSVVAIAEVAIGGRTKVLPAPEPEDVAPEGVVSSDPETDGVASVRAVMRAYMAG